MTSRVTTHVPVPTELHYPFTRMQNKVKYYLETNQITTHPQLLLFLQIVQN